MNKELKLLLQDFDNVVEKCNLGNLHSNKKTLLSLSEEIKQAVSDMESKLDKIDKVVNNIPRQEVLNHSILLPIKQILKENNNEK